MKQIPIIAAILLCFVLLIQNAGTAGTAGPRGTPTVLRTVPVNSMEVMQPSKMVAVSVNHGTNQVQLPVPLQVGQVFVLTSWSVSTPGADGQERLTEGSATTLEAIRDSLYVVSNDAVKEHHHVIPTGIRFPRDAGGLANAYVGGAAPSVTVSAQGYVTDDF